MEEEEERILICPVRDLQRVEAQQVPPLSLSLARSLSLTHPLSLLTPFDFDSLPLTIDCAVTGGTSSTPVTQLRTRARAVSGERYQCTVHPSVHPCIWPGSVRRPCPTLPPLVSISDPL